VTNGWADKQLKLLGYDQDPTKIELMIQFVCSECISEIRIEGCEIVCLPLSEVLDKKNPNDYVERVEPSV